MLGYFIKAGDVKVDEAFYPYTLKFRNIIKKNMLNKTYGEGLKLILIEYHLEGEFLPLLENHMKLAAYRKNEQSIAVIIGIPKSFADLQETEKKKLIVDTTFEAVEAVQAKMQKKGFDKINFSELLDDLQACAREYLG